MLHWPCTAVFPSNLYNNTVSRFDQIHAKGGSLKNYISGCHLQIILCQMRGEPIQLRSWLPVYRRHSLSSDRTDLSPDMFGRRQFWSGGIVPLFRSVIAISSNKEIFLKRKNVIMRFNHWEDRVDFAACSGLKSHFRFNSKMIKLIEVRRSAALMNFLVEQTHANWPPHAKKFGMLESVHPTL